MEPVVRTIIDRYFHTSQSKQFSALAIILENNPYLLLHLENQKISESDSFIVSKDDEHHSKNGYSPLVTRVYKHSQNNKVMFYGRCADGEYKHLPMEGCYMHFMSVLPPKEENRLSDSYGCDPFSGYEDSYLCVEEKREGKKDTKKSTLRLYYVNEERSCIPIDIPEEKISEFTKQIEELRISEFNKHAEEIRRSSPLANYHIINKIQLDNNQITQVIVKATGHTPSNLDLFSHIQFGKSNNNLESALEGVPSTKRREVLSRILTKIREIHWPYDNYLEKCKAMVEKSFGQMSGHEENRKIILEKVNTAENRFKLIRMLAFLVRIFKANESSLLLNSTLDLGKQVFEMLGEQGGTRQKLEPVAGKVESVKGLSLFKLATQPSYIPSPSPKETKLPEEKVQADKKRKLSSISSS